jgi:hypothetical protein
MMGKELGIETKDMSFVERNIQAYRKKLGMTE